MKYSKPKPVRDVLIDIVPIDHKGRIWLQQDKPSSPDWTLLRRYTTNADTLGYAHHELTKLGFIVHELMILREGELFWSQDGKSLRMPHLLVLAEVNATVTPTDPHHYLQAYEYADALKLRQHHSSDLRQLFDPTIDIMIRRQPAGLTTST